MKLADILKDVEIIEVYGDKNIEITDISSNSRECPAGSLFIAIKGFVSDGHKYITGALEGGAAAVVLEDSSYADAVRQAGAVAVIVKDSRSATSVIAGNFFRHPSREINLVGVTGTNGKTTIATLLYRLFTQMGYCCGLLSTIANYICDEKFETTNTTQDPITLNRLMRMMADRGCEYCFMEVSSHSLHQGRVAGLKFRGAIFTNLTHDHLDYHGTFSEYIRCKKMLFDSLGKDAFALINIDDRNGMVMTQNTAAKVCRYSIRSMAEYRVKIIESSIAGSMLNINGTELWTSFIGEYNAHNICAVYGAATLLGAPEMEVLTTLSSMGPVNGRMEYIRGPRNITAVVDYAHTPDALENVLRTLGDIPDKSSLAVVFGCGGDRDRTKRPEMGAIAVKYADRVIVTSDNPRSENPDAIIEDIRAGIDRNGLGKTIFIADRKEAIRTSILTAPDASIVLVAGKGHEDYQIINGVKSHFDDKEVIREVFEMIK